ncbi:hypothetical protein EXIGLDRAFT_498211 [Exidia glandulosa HHB12029]|uniref:Uncharacterized protein n=1 Tax=Exidia glandulosa HHB12029 TaxID=1314781 RepID=A0A166N904_EXIGL|nr:hypothetical protein EXIGLDRAFT_498211 [Exidia glandulosa HHB12029]
MVSLRSLAPVLAAATSALAAVPASGNYLIGSVGGGVVNRYLNAILGQTAPGTQVIGQMLSQAPFGLPPEQWNVLLLRNISAPPSGLYIFTSLVQPNMTLGLDSTGSTVVIQNTPIVFNATEVKPKLFSILPQGSINALTAQQQFTQPILLRPLQANGFSDGFQLFGFTPNSCS